MKKNKLLIIYCGVLFFTSIFLFFYFKHENPVRCESHYIIKVNEQPSGRTIISDGSMLMTFFQDGNGVGVYIGNISYETPSQAVVNKAVNKTFKFTYSLKYDQITLKTENLINNIGNAASEEDVQRYVYQGFKEGKVTHGTLLNIDGTYAIGENLNPKNICYKVEND